MIEDYNFFNLQILINSPWHLPNKKIHNLIDYILQDISNPASPRQTPEHSQGLTWATTMTWFWHIET